MTSQIPSELPESARQSTGGSLIVRNRNEFHERGFKLLAKIVIGQTVIIGIMGIGLISTAGQRDRVQTVAVTADNRVIELPTSEDPYLSAERVRGWTVDAIMRAYDWDYRNYRTRFTELLPYMTRPGFDAYMITLRDSKRVDFVRDNQLAVSFTPASSAIIGEGPFRGAYRWRMEIRGAMAYSASGRADRTENLTLTVDVERVDVRQNAIGVAIVQIVETRAR